MFLPTQITQNSVPVHRASIHLLNTTIYILKEREDHAQISSYSCRRRDSYY